MVPYIGCIFGNETGTAGSTPRCTCYEGFEHDAGFFHAIDNGPCDVPTWYPLFTLACCSAALIFEIVFLIVKARRQEITIRQRLWLLYIAATLSTFFMIVGYYAQNGFYEVSLIFQTFQQIFFAPCVLGVVQAYYKPMFHRQPAEVARLNQMFRRMIRLTLVFLPTTSFAMFITCRMSDAIYNWFALSNIIAAFLLIVNFSFYLLIALRRLRKLLRMFPEMHSNLGGAMVTVLVNGMICMTLPIVAWIVIAIVFQYAPFFFVWIWVSNVLSPLMFLKTIFAILKKSPLSSRQVEANAAIENQRTRSVGFPFFPTSYEGKKGSSEAKAYLSMSPMSSHHQLVVVDGAAIGNGISSVSPQIVIPINHPENEGTSNRPQNNNDQQHPKRGKKELIHSHHSTNYEASTVETVDENSLFSEERTSQGSRQ